MPFCTYLLWLPDSCCDFCLDDRCQSHNSPIRSTGRPDCGALHRHALLVRNNLLMLHTNSTLGTPVFDYRRGEHITSPIHHITELELQQHITSLTHRNPETSHRCHTITLTHRISLNHNITNTSYHWPGCAAVNEEKTIAVLHQKQWSNIKWGYFHLERVWCLVSHSLRWDSMSIT